MKNKLVQRLDGYGGYFKYLLRYSPIVKEI